VIGAYLPKAQIRVSTVVNAQATVDMLYRRISTSCLTRLIASLIDCSMDCRRTREKSQNRKDSGLHNVEIITPKNGSRSKKGEAPKRLALFANSLTC
jgi:hypothetical protein